MQVLGGEKSENRDLVALVAAMRPCEAAYRGDGAVLGPRLVQRVRRGKVETWIIN